MTEKLVQLDPEHGVAILNGAFINSPDLRCTGDGIHVIKHLIEKLSRRGFKRLYAPPHLDGRDVNLIRFFNTEFTTLYDLPSQLAVTGWGSCYL